MSKPTVAPAPRKGQAVTFLYAGDKLKLHPVLIELSRASASLWLLQEIDSEDVRPPDEDTLEWIRSMALEDLSNALKTARAEFVKATELHQVVL